MKSTFTALGLGLLPTVFQTGPFQGATATWGGGGTSEN